MRLFQIPTGARVRLTSKLVRWVEHQSEQKIAENVTWEGTTTDKYFYYKGAERRLIVDHTIEFAEYGVWQRDTEAIVISDNAPNKYNPSSPKGVVIND